jgi:uncharacterized protein (DUF302 family)
LREASDWQNVGVIVERSQLSYAETAGSLLAAVQRRGLTLFARIDHAAGARGAGLELADEQLFVLGNPTSGTALMQRDPRVGIELPLRMLIWREGDDVLIGFHDPRELAASYDVVSEQATLERMAALLGELAAEAAVAPPAD